MTSCLDVSNASSNWHAMCIIGRKAVASKSVWKVSQGVPLMQAGW